MTPTAATCRPSLRSPYALTAKNQYNDLSSQTPSLIEAAKAAGFHTVWISNQVRFSAWDAPTTIIASEADEQHWRNSHLGTTADLDVYDDALAEELTRMKSSEKTSSSFIIWEATCPTPITIQKLREDPQRRSLSRPI